MTDQSKHYVVLRASGRVMTFRDALTGSVPHHIGPYLSILAAIADEQSTAGSNYDPPEQLFLNGKLVVERGLSSLAWKFRQDVRAAQAEATNAVRNIHMPDWLPSDEVKPGYNPPGIDKWIVRKLGAPGDPLARCTEVADQTVPEYRDGKRRYSCGSHTAKRWQAAWDGAHIALGGDPEAYPHRFKGVHP